MPRKALLFEFFVLLLLCLSCFGSNFIKINPTTNQFIDSVGRTKLFHGVNAVYKIPPWQPELNTFNPETSLTDEDMKNLQSWGFNVVRLGVMWPGVSIGNQVYNQTYLDTMNDLVEKMGSYGIYTIVDCHQDIFSRYYCGEGVPDWAVLDNSILNFPEPVRSPDSLSFDPVTGYPNITDCLEISFFEYYFTGAVSQGFQDLYDNRRHLQDHFINYWEQVANTFKNNSYVLGYELINEPWCGDFYKHPKALVFPGYADSTFLFPMYQNLNQAIRKIDDDHILFFEPAVSDVFPCGFTEGPGGPDYNDRQAYSYHVYCAPTDLDGDPTKPLLCNDTYDYYFHIRKGDREKMNVAGFMTEFGAMKGTRVGVESLDYVTDKADEQIQSWAYWQFKYFQDITTASRDGAESFYVDGQLDIAKVIALSRTYAPTIAGTPTKHLFDSVTNIFQLEFTVDSTLVGQTSQIYYNQQYRYPNGVQLQLSANLQLVSNTNGTVTIQNLSTGNASVLLTPA